MGSCPTGRGASTLWKGAHGGRRGSGSRGGAGEPGQRAAHLQDTVISTLVAGMLPANNLDEVFGDTVDDVNRELGDLNAIDAIEDVRDVIRRIADMNDVIELSEGFAPSMVTAIGKIGGSTVGCAGV